MSHAAYHKEQSKCKTTKQQKKKKEKKKITPGEQNPPKSSRYGPSIYEKQNSDREEGEKKKKSICVLLVVHLQLKIDFIPMMSGLGSLSTSSVIMVMNGTKKMLTHQFKSREVLTSM